MRLMDLLADGVALGAGYALLAIGWTVLLGAARLVNFATGQLYMLGGFTTWWLVAQLGIPYYLALPLIILGGVIIGALMQFVLARLIAERNLVSIMLATLAIGFAFSGLAGIVFGDNPQIVPSPLAGGQIAFGDSRLPHQDALIIVLAVVMYVAVWFVLKRTRAGAYVRAVSEDPPLATLYGINPMWIYAGVLGFSVAAAMVSGWALTPRGPILTSIGFQEVIITFAVVVIGGIGRIWGNFIAAIGLGLFVALISQIWVAGYAMAAAFAVVIVFLVARRQEVGVR